MVPVQAASTGTEAALLLPQVCKRLCGRLRGQGRHASQRDVPWKRNLKLPPLPANVKNTYQKIEALCEVGKGERKAAPFVLSRDVYFTSLSHVNEINVTTRHNLGLTTCPNYNH